MASPYASNKDLKYLQQVYTCQHFARIKMDVIVNLGLIIEK